MLQMHGIRESRIFKEGRQEGIQEGEHAGQVKERARTVRKLLAKGNSPQEIANFLEVDVETVKAVAQAVPPTN